MRHLFRAVQQAQYLIEMIDMNKNLENLNIRIRTLTVFRALLDDPVIKALCHYLSSLQNGVLSESVSAYSDFVSLIYKSGNGNLTEYIRNIVNNDENVYIKTIGCKKAVERIVEECVAEELKILQEISSLTPDILRSSLNWEGFLPSFNTSNVDISVDYKHRVDNIQKYGYGIYAQYHMFYVNEQNNIVPVKNPDGTRLESLIDYKREQKIIVDNTLALLEDKPAANILLTGDAGTGKSSTVKAVVNELYDRGLRIIEVRKEQLREIPALLDELSVNPLKFILFIDDLSFQKDDDNYSALKAVLEGSVSAKSSNVVIYATSNRRHLVKETFSDREGDDVHRNDTMQEMLSLSDRFGIQITFQKPDKKTYLDIVSHLAKESGILLPKEELELLAEQFALSRGGRSARAAKQLIDDLIARGTQQ